MTHRSSRIWQFILLGSCVLLASAATGLAPIADGDIFWHLASGREIWRSGRLLTEDPFSVGAAGRPWPDVHWLFQLGAFGVHAKLGLFGLVLAKCALVGIAASLFVWGSPRPARVPTALALIAVLFCARQLLLVRPVIVSLVMLGLFCAQLERSRRHGGKLWLLPLAQVVWCNCQGLSALGPAVVAAYCAGAVVQGLLAARAVYPFAPELVRTDPYARRKHLQALRCCLAMCLVACVATPFGTSGLSLPLRLLARLAPTDGSPFQQIAENVPAYVAERTGAGDFWHLKWFIGLLALSVAARRARVLLSELLLLTGFAALALISNRNVLLLYVVATPIAARQLLPALRWCRYRLRRLHSQRWTGALAGTAFVVLSSVVATAAAREPRLDSPTPFHLPVESTAAIAAHGGEGKVFSADNHGGYLIWMLYPRFRPYFDTRWILRSSNELSKYLQLIDHPTQFDEFAREHELTYAVLPVAYPSRFLPLVAHLYHSDGWRLVFTNGSEVLFAHRARVQAQSWDLGSDSTTDYLLANIQKVFIRPELQHAARMQLAMLDIAVGEHTQAERAVRGLTSAGARALVAQARLLAGDLAGATIVAEQLQRENPNNVHSLTLLAALSIRRQEVSIALDRLARAIVVDPFDDELTRLLASLEEIPDAH